MSSRSLSLSHSCLRTCGISEWTLSSISMHVGIYAIILGWELVQSDMHYYHTTPVVDSPFNCVTTKRTSRLILYTSFVETLKLMVQSSFVDISEFRLFRTIVKIPPFHLK